MPASAFKLCSIACFWEQEQENNINRLVADSREVNRVAQTLFKA
jgi:hypothetical protein